MTTYTITPTGTSAFQVTCNTCGDSAERRTRAMAEASGNAHRCAPAPVKRLPS